MERAAKRIPSIPVMLAVLVCAGFALLFESQLKLSLHLPGHRALPGAMALVILATAAPRSVLVGFAAVIGVLLALMSQTPLLAIVWLVPAVLLALLQPGSMKAPVAIAIGAGLAFGLLRYLAMPGALHHTPEAVRLGGHLFFGALGSVGLAVSPRPKADA